MMIHKINLIKPIISPNGYPQIIFVNIGVLTVYLGRKYPKNACEMQLIENVLNEVNA